MRKNSVLLAGIGLAVLSMASCSKNEKFIGSWESTNPLDITKEIPSASTASATISVTFGPNAEGKGGDFILSSLISASQPVVTNPDIVSGYETDVAATATIKGTWNYEGDSDDDLIVTFDKSTFKVDVDPAGVTFRQNQITDAQEPVTDSLTNATAMMWKQQISRAMEREFARFSRLDDVKSKDGSTMKLEIENPEQDLYFRTTMNQ